MKIRNYSDANFDSNLKSHILSVNERKKPFKCQICHFISFSQNGDLKSHILAVHEGKKPFECQICSHSCFIKKDLKKHVASVHEKKKQFKCQICYVIFSQNSDMKRHTLSVHEEKKQICEHSFFSKKWLGSPCCISSWKKGASSSIYVTNVFLERLKWISSQGE